jgi:hypothetical protein
MGQANAFARGGAVVHKASRRGLVLLAGCQTAVGGGRGGSNKGVDGIKKADGCTRSCVHEGEGVGVH